MIMKKKIYKFFVLLIAVLPILFTSVSAETGSYYYDNSAKAHEAPSAYEWNSETVFGNGSIPNVGKISDIHTDSAGNIYILSSDSGKITVLDFEMNFLRTLTVKKDGQVDCSGASGMFILESNGKTELYIADTTHNRILKTDDNGNLLKSYTRPKTELIDEKTEFMPTKIIVNASGYIITTCRGIYSGAVVMNGDGEFLGFYGSNKIKLSATVIYDYFWKQLFGASRSGVMSRYVPVEFSNLAINENGFVYTTTAAETDNAGLRLLNFSSESLLPEYQQGDLQNITREGEAKNSTFVDVAYLGTGIAAVLDSARSRIFLYNSEGDLLTVFGGNGGSRGMLTNPTAIAAYNDEIFVVDEAANSITRFSKTEYGNNLISASRMYMKGNYDESRELWEQIITQNNGFNTAYISVGRTLMSLNDYEGAMEYFKLGKSKSDYSEAFSQQRKIVLKKWFIPIFSFIVIAVALLFYLVSDKRAKKRKKSDTSGEGIVYSLVHPSKGLLNAVNGNTGFGIWLLPIVLGVWFITNIFSVQYSGFIFNKLDSSPLDLRVEFIATVIAGIGFVISNWLVVTMTEGTGSFKQISRVAAIALIPYIGGKLIYTALSNIMLLNESMIVNAPVTIGVIWGLLILIIGLSKIHEYKITGAVINLAATVLGMAAVAFILLLEISILKQIQMLATTVFDELVMLLQ